LKFSQKNKVPYNYFVVPLAQAYLEAKAYDKGLAVVEDLLNLTLEKLNYFFSLKPSLQAYTSIDKQQNLFVIQELISTLETLSKDTTLNASTKDKVNKLLNTAKPKFDEYVQKFFATL